MSKTNIPNPGIYAVKQLGKGQLWVMSKPDSGGADSGDEDSGDKLEDEIRKIRRVGIDLVVSLLEKHEERTLSLQAEASLCVANKMDFLSYPIPNRGFPESVESYRLLTRDLYHKIRDGRSVAIHCHAGIGRTGMVSVGVLLQSGLLPDAAFDLVCERRQVQVPDTVEQRNWVVDNYHDIIA